jgi:hypothetical protein
MGHLTPARLEALNTEHNRLRPPLEAAPAVLQRLSSMAGRWYKDEQWRRDALDMARTVANRGLFVALALGSRQMEAWRTGKADAAAIRQTAQASRGMMAALGDVLAQSDDFSMDASIRLLGQARPLGGVQPVINPHAELTLKANAENDYCRSHMVELVRGAYQPETAAYWDWVERRLESKDRGPWRRPADFAKQAKSIEDKFYATPLAQLAPAAERGPEQLAEAIGRLNAQVRKLLDAEGAAEK